MSSKNFEKKLDRFGVFAISLNLLTFIIYFMGAKKTKFENFLLVLLSKPKGVVKFDDVKILPEKSSFSWEDDLKQILVYAFPSDLKNRALEMKLVGVSTGAAYFAVNPITQKLCFLNPETEREGIHNSNYLTDLVRKTASKYGIQEVDTIKELYNTLKE